MIQTLSYRTKGFIAFGALFSLMAAAVFVLQSDKDVQIADVSEPVETVSLASLAIGPEDFGVAAPLDVRPTTLKRRETLSDVLKRLDLPGNDGHRALRSLTSNDLLDARRVRPGLEVTAHVAGD
ncbi:MAG: hypothetical protein AAGJ68_04620, partial [Pseudomonadota bacterium]